MKILQLCSKPPLPTIDGGCIAMNNLSKSFLHLGHELHMLSVCTDKHPFSPEFYTEEYLKKTKFEAVYIDTKVNLIDAFTSLINQENYNISRFFSVDFDLLLKKYLRKHKYDLVVLESLFMTPYLATIRQFNKAKVVLRSHNLEFHIWQRLAQQEQSKPKKIYLNYLAKQLKNYELNVINQLDGLISISKSDRDKYTSYGCKIPTISLPLGIDEVNYPFVKKEMESVVRCFHIGAMDWTPNQEGISWFLQDVWPKVLKAKLNCELFLAGKDLNENLDKIKGDLKNTHICGAVPSAVDFMNQHDIMVVPLLSGGGIRIKIIEGMALGKAVVSTKVGAEGIDGKHGKHFFLADSADEFAQHLITLIQDKERVKQIGDDARAFALKTYSFEQINKQLADFIKQVIPN